MVVAVDLVYYVMCIISIHDVCDVCVCVVGARFRFRIHGHAGHAAAPALVISQEGQEEERAHTP